VKERKKNKVVWNIAKEVAKVGSGWFKKLNLPPPTATNLNTIPPHKLLFSAHGALWGLGLDNLRACCHP